jgi:anaerobic dimethyl sulfoxide reductase subunit B (iron-sulfur subunit)
MSTYGWLLDPKRCIECRACETACKQWNQVPTAVGIRYRKVRVAETGVSPNVTVSSLSIACNHCADATCVKVCPVKAVTRRSDGIITIDGSRCLACRQCEQFCPYGAPQFNTALKRMEKCTMCLDRTDQGLQPACATLCPTGALKWGDWDTFRNVGTDRVNGFPSPNLTKPRVRFVTTGWGE